jgi:hypothetical protein
MAQKANIGLCQSHACLGCLAKSCFERLRVLSAPARRKVSRSSDPSARKDARSGAARLGDDAEQPRPRARDAWRAGGRGGASDGRGHRLGGVPDSHSVHWAASMGAECALPHRPSASRDRPTNGEIDSRVIASSSGRHRLSRITHYATCGARGEGGRDTRCRGRLSS